LGRVELGRESRGSEEDKYEKEKHEEEGKDKSQVREWEIVGKREHIQMGGLLQGEYLIELGRLRKKVW
jgi:hypothetical protein